MAKLENRVALITGSTRGIGHATALMFAREGADIVVNGRPEESAVERDAAAKTVAAIEAIGRRAIFIPADVGDRTQVESLFAGAIDHFGHLDIVLANAAYNVKQKVVDAEWPTVQRIFDVAMFGVFHACQLAAQQMTKQNQAGREGGKILINGSVHGDIAVPFHAAYGMSKAAINQLCRILAAELAPFRINVNCVNPGWTDTENERTFISDAELQAAAKRLPWKRLATPDEIAKAFLYLASDDASYVSGHTIVVDGGLELDYGMLTDGL